MSQNIYSSFKAAIIDMDGVITQTANLHAQAWKQMFDEFLKKKVGDDFQPLQIVTDYKQFIDGIPRFEGVRRFLKSRNIEIPEGNPDDETDSETVSGLGRRKNELFLDILEKEGVQVFEDTLEIIKKWKKEGVKLAVISSSRNCKKIIRTAGLTELFDVMVDGEISEKENLKGKPEPDIFFKANDLLESELNQTIIIEDAIMGVKAGKKGKFALVVGVARNGEEEDLLKAGADVVVSELTELEEKMKQIGSGKMAEELPNALEKIDYILEKLDSKQPILFLDYDGTLTPIVSNPDAANLDKRTKRILEELSKKITVGIISGRDRKDIKSKIGIDTVIYAGSHGFDITGPNDLEMQYELGQKILPILDEVEKHLNKKLEKVDGAKVERKKYAIAVHYGNVPEAKIQDVESAVFQELEEQEKLKKGSGKKILELKPDLDWHKGRALTYLMESIELNSESFLPIFIGDDITDEDALEEIRRSGVGIIVGSHNQKTSASFNLKDTNEVIQFLNHLKDWLKENTYLQNSEDNL